MKQDLPDTRTEAPEACQDTQPQQAKSHPSEIDIKVLLGKRNITRISKYTYPHEANKLLPGRDLTVREIDAINNFCKEVKNQDISIIDFAHLFFKSFQPLARETRSPQVIEEVFYSLAKHVYSEKTFKSFESFQTHGAEYLLDDYNNEGLIALSDLPKLIDVLLLKAQFNDTVQISWGYPSETEKKLCKDWTDALSRDLHSFSAADSLFKRSLLVSLLLSMRHPELIAPLLLSEVSLSEKDYSDLILQKRFLSAFEERLLFAHAAIELASCTPDLSIMKERHPKNFEEFFTRIIFIHEEDQNRNSKVTELLVDLAKYSRTLSITTLETLMTAELPYKSKKAEISSFRDKLVTVNAHSFTEETILKIASSTCSPEQKAALLLTYDRAFLEVPRVCFPEYKSVSDILIEEINSEKHSHPLSAIIDTSLTLFLYDDHYTSLFNQVLNTALSRIPPPMIQHLPLESADYSERFTDPLIQGVFTFLTSKLTHRYHREHKLTFYGDPLSDVSDISPHLTDSNLFVFLKQAAISGTTFDREDIAKGLFILIRLMGNTSSAFHNKAITLLCSSMPSIGDVGTWAIKQFNEISFSDITYNRTFDTLREQLPSALRIDDPKMLDTTALNHLIDNPDHLQSDPQIAIHASNLLDMVSRLFTSNPHIARVIASAQMLKSIRELQPHLPLHLHSQVERLMVRLEESTHNKKTWVVNTIDECCDRILNDPASRIEFWTQQLRALITKFAIKEFETEIPGFLSQGCIQALSSYSQATVPPSMFEQRAYELISVFKDTDGFWDNPSCFDLILTLNTIVFPIVSKNKDEEKMKKWTHLLSEMLPSSPGEHP